MDHPHPFLKSSVLYLDSVPEQVEETNLRNIFDPCSKVLAFDRLEDGKGGVSWVMVFDSLRDAEVALATLNGRTIGSSVAGSWKIKLSPDRDGGPSHTLEGRPWPQYLKSVAANPINEYWSAQQVFELFRAAGPLVSVRTGVYIGMKQSVCVVHYYEQSHARAAQAQVVDPFNQFHQAKATLQPFDPYTVFCSTLDKATTQEMLLKHFQQAGPVDAVHLFVTKHSGPNLGFVKYEEEAHADRAMVSLDGTSLQSKKVVLRRCDVKDLMAPRHKMSSVNAQGSKQDIFSEGSKMGDQTPDVPEVSVAESSVDSKPLSRSEHFSRYIAARQRRLAAEEDDLKALLSRNEVLDEEAGVAKELEETQQIYRRSVEEHQTARHELLEAEKARVEAEKREALLRERQRELEDSMKLRTTELQRVRARAEDVRCRRREADEALEEALQQRNELKADEGKLYEEWYATSVSATSFADGILESVTREEDQRRAEIRAKEAENRRIADEAKREQERADAERLQEKRDILLRGAVIFEKTRCVIRDSRWPYGATWTVSQALARYQVVSDEFENTKFNDDQPLTLWSVPWPVLHHPLDLVWDQVESQIEWGTVEAFFKEVKFRLSSAEYKALVEKAHRRFHPDKWRSRGLYNTVPSETRAALEGASNRVAQALTPLWISTRNT